jgi:sugar phosphate isomerase/epimerase
MIYVSTACLKPKDGRFYKNILDVVKIYAELGIKNIELGAAHAPFDDIDALKQLQKKHGLNFIAHGNFPALQENKMLNLASPDEEFRQICISQVLKTLDIIHSLGGNFISLHPGFVSDITRDLKFLDNKSDMSLATARTIDSLKILTARAKTLGIRIAIENSSNYQWSVVCTPADFKKVKKHVDVGLLLDVGHLDTYLFHHEGNKLEFIKEFEPFIEEMHCHKAINNDEHLLPEKQLFQHFKKETLKKARLTLESNNLSEKEVILGKKLLEEL